jgi:hypothetical protein
MRLLILIVSMLTYCLNLNGQTHEYWPIGKNKFLKFSNSFDSIYKGINDKSRGLSSSVTIDDSEDLFVYGSKNAEDDFKADILVYPKSNIGLNSKLILQKLEEGVSCFKINKHQIILHTNTYLNDTFLNVFYIKYNEINDCSIENTSNIILNRYKYTQKTFEFVESRLIDSDRIEDFVLYQKDSNLYLLSTHAKPQTINIVKFNKNLQVVESKINYIFNDNISSNVKWSAEYRTSLKISPDGNRFAWYINKPRINKQSWESQLVKYLIVCNVSLDSLKVESNFILFKNALPDSYEFSSNSQFLYTRVKCNTLGGQSYQLGQFDLNNSYTANEIDVCKDAINLLSTPIEVLSSTMKIPLEITDIQLTPNNSLYLMLNNPIKQYNSIYELTDNNVISEHALKLKHNIPYEFDSSALPISLSYFSKYFPKRVIKQSQTKLLLSKLNLCANEKFSGIFENGYKVDTINWFINNQLYATSNSNEIDLRMKDTGIFEISAIDLNFPYDTVRNYFHVHSFSYPVPNDTIIARGSCVSLTQKAGYNLWVNNTRVYNWPICLDSTNKYKLSIKTDMCQGLDSFNILVLDKQVAPQHCLRDTVVLSSMAHTFTIDWGDGVVNNTNKHKYKKANAYDIKIKVIIDGHTIEFTEKINIIYKPYIFPDSIVRCSAVQNKLEFNVTEPYHFDTDGFLSKENMTQSGVNFITYQDNEGCFYTDTMLQIEVNCKPRQIGFCMGDSFAIRIPSQNVLDFEMSNLAGKKAIFEFKSFSTYAAMPYEIKLKTVLGTDIIVKDTARFYNKENWNVKDSLKACMGFQVYLPNAKFIWMTGSNGALLVNKNGWQSYVYSNFKCISTDSVFIIADDCNCQLWVPNTLKRSQSELLIESNCDYAKLDLKIFNRWGGLVYKAQLKQGEKLDLGQVSLIEGVYVINVIGQYSNSMMANYKGVLHILGW